MATDLPDKEQQLNKAAPPGRASSLPGIWLHRGVRAWLLWPVSLLYRFLGVLRALLYRLGVSRSVALPVPVVVVGNVVVGGGGKTPTILALVEHLKSRGWRPGIVSRGYGAEALRSSPRACLRVDTDPGAAVRFGDEPALLARVGGVPVVVGRQRALAARVLLEQAPEVDIILSDDGMQHWALARDLTLVLFDERGMGNGWLLPAGLLREPWPPATAAQPWQRRISAPLPAYMVLVRRTGQSVPPDGHPRFAVSRRLAAQAVSAGGLKRPMAELAQAGATRGTPLCALAGIAQPESFFRMLEAQGFALAETQALPDHAETATLTSALQDALTRAPDSCWLVTEKDAVKCFEQLPPAWRNHVWAVSLEQELDPGFWLAFDACLKAWEKSHEVGRHMRAP